MGNNLKAIDNISISPILEGGHIVGAYPDQVTFDTWGSQAAQGWAVISMELDNADLYTRFVFIGEEAEAQARSYAETLPQFDDTVVMPINFCFHFDPSRVWWEVSFSKVNYQFANKPDPEMVWSVESVIRQEGQGDNYEFGTVRNGHNGRLEVFIRIPKEEDAVKEALALVEKHTGQKTVSMLQAY